MISVVARKKGAGHDISYSFHGGYNKMEARTDVRKRLGLIDDIGEVYENIDTDPYMHRAIASLRGLRLTESTPWEATLCFLVSQFNNIKRIRLIMKNLIAVYGEEIYVGREKVKLFPTPDALSRASIEGLKRCNAGFRAEYIKSVAQEWGSFRSERIYKMDYESAKETLMKFDGIGEKVADCILLMGYRKMEAFPVDVWIKRIMEQRYMKRGASHAEIREFAGRIWKENAGYAQQYIYWYGRNFSGD